MITDPAALLRERGLQVTAQRMAVLRAVSRQPHITADAVSDLVRAEIGSISRQSVYDSLSLLVAEGLLRRIQPSGSPARFEDRVGDNHHHLICRTCGQVVDVDCTVGAAPCLTPHANGGYEIDEAEVAFWGRCPSCLEAAGSRARPRRTSSTSRVTPAIAPATPPAASSRGQRVPRSNTRHPRRTT
jgi:Fe2+ or Zn2+ uptake regulation protein